MQQRTVDDQFAVGDGVNTGSGDSYPSRIVWISKSGKQVRIVSMDYSARLPADGSSLQAGHQSWECYDSPDIDYKNPNQGRTYTLRKNGKWIAKGSSLSAYYMSMRAGAHYHYQWEV